MCPAFMSIQAGVAFSMRARRAASVCFTFGLRSITHIDWPIAVSQLNQVLAAWTALPLPFSERLSLQLRSHAWDSP